MKSEDYQILKKLYVKPDIKRLAIDRNISIAMNTNKDEPPPEIEDPDPWTDDPSPAPGYYPSGKKPNYGNHTYKPENPFGGSRPEY